MYYHEDLNRAFETQRIVLPRALRSGILGKCEVVAESSEGACVNGTRRAHGDWGLSANKLLKSSKNVTSFTPSIFFVSEFRVLRGLLSEFRQRPLRVYENSGRRRGHAQIAALCSP